MAGSSMHALIIINDLFLIAQEIPRCFRAKILAHLKNVIIHVAYFFNFFNHLFIFLGVRHQFSI